VKEEVMTGQTIAPFSGMEALRVGWKLTRENLRPLLVLGLFGGFLGLLHQALNRPSEHPGIAPLLAVVVQLAQAALFMALLRASLQLVDGGTIDLNRPQELLGHFFGYLLTTVLLTLIVAGGLVLLVVPGVVWALRFGYAPFLVADTAHDPVEALRESARITQGVKRELLAFAATALVLNLIGALAFGVGLLITVPTTTVAAAHVLRLLQARAGTAGSADRDRQPPLTGRDVPA
jgi:uncharacterized membrane protein